MSKQNKVRFKIRASKALVDAVRSVSAERCIAPSEFLEKLVVREIERKKHAVVD